MENKGPVFLKYSIPIIEVLKQNNNQGKPKDIIEKVIKFCNISEDNLGEKLKSGGNRIKNQINWARFYLMKAGYIDSTVKGIWKLTDNALNTTLSDDDVYKFFKEVHNQFNENYENEDETLQEIEDETIQEIEDENKSDDIDIANFFNEIDFERFNQHQQLCLSDPQRIKIQDIITKCENANWVIPLFQRYFDWNKTNVKELLESIFYEYYVGSFLLWKTSTSSELGIQPVLGKNIDVEKLNPDEIILDAQQRITAIYYAIKAPNINIKGSKNRLYFYINFQKFLENKEKTDVIEIHTTKLTDEKTFANMLFPLFKLEKYQHWIDNFEDFLLSKKIEYDKIKKIRRILEKKLNYFWSGFEIPYISLPNQIDLNQVTDIFEKINTKGKQLNVFDLLIARLYKENIPLKELWNNTLNSYPLIKRYYINGKINKIPIYILQSISLYYRKTSTAKQSDLLNIYMFVYSKKKEKDIYEDWDDFSFYLELALKRLENMKDGFGVRSEKDLPFQPMIPVLTALLKKVEESPNKIGCNKKIKIWYWSAIFTSAYSSAADSQMTTDFKEMKNWFENDSLEPKVVSNFRKNIPLLDFYDIQSTSNTKYKGILSLIALKGAKDLNTGLNLENCKENDKDHIFPKSMESIPAKYKNSILNMTWMSDKTNRIIKSGKKPSIYINEFLKEKYKNKESELKTVFKTHFIDEDIYMALKSDDFDTFLQLRQKILIDYLLEITDSKIEKKNSKSLISNSTPFSNRLAFLSVLNQCKKYIYWLDKYFSVKGMEYIAESISENNVSEIKIIMSIEKIEENFRKRFKDFKSEFKSKSIEVQLKVLVDAKLKSSIHDRFIISNNMAFNIPSPDIIARNQLSEITESSNHNSLEIIFKNIWDNSLDIIDDWNKILTIKNNKDNGST